jgi:hypothetical protein
VNDPQRARELAQQSVISVGQILSNYQAALHLFEEAVAGDVGDTVPRERALEFLGEAARAVFAPVLEACAGVAPGLDDLVSESIGSAGDVRTPAPAPALREVVIAERQRVAATHSRLITRQPRLVAAGERADYATLVAAARRLDELETGSHSAGALFNQLLDRWMELLRSRA